MSAITPAIAPTHKRRGIASFVIGVACVLITLMLAAIVFTDIQIPAALFVASGMISGAMLCANLIGIALGIWGATDRSSKKLYPALGLILNVGVLAFLVVLAYIGL